jgi:hypothetical protein
MMQEIGINCDFTMGNLSILPRATGSAGNVTAMFIKIGRRASTEKGQDILWGLVREHTISVPTATTPMNQNLSR